MSSSRRILMSQGATVPMFQWQQPFTFNTGSANYNTMSYIYDIIYDDVHSRYVMIWRDAGSSKRLSYNSTLDPNLDNWTMTGFGVISPTFPTTLFHDTVNNNYIVGFSNGEVWKVDCNYLGTSSWQTASYPVLKIINNTNSSNNITIIAPPYLAMSNGTAWNSSSGAVPATMTDAMQFGNNMAGTTSDGRLVQGNGSYPIATWSDAIIGLPPMRACTMFDTINDAAFVGDNGTVVYVGWSLYEQHNYTATNLNTVCWDGVNEGKLYFGGQNGYVASLNTRGDAGFPTETPVKENPQTSYDILKLKLLNNNIVGLTSKGNEIIIRNVINPLFIN